jgi:hypothetical protein
LWYKPVNLALRKQEDQEFKASLGCIVRLCLIKQKQTKKKKSTFLTAERMRKDIPHPFKDTS